jgi:hypothetical protein
MEGWSHAPDAVSNRNVAERMPETEPDMSRHPDPSKRSCTLLFFLATPAEEGALEEAAKGRHLPFEKMKDHQ